MSSRQTSGGMAMDHEAVRALGVDVADLATALQDVQRYHGELGLAPEHFGGTDHGAPAGAQFTSAATALAQSVGKASTFAEQTAKRLAASAESTQDTDDTAAGDFSGRAG